MDTANDDNIIADFQIRGLSCALCEPTNPSDIGYSGKMIISLFSFIFSPRGLIGMALYLAYTTLRVLGWRLVGRQSCPQSWTALMEIQVNFLQFCCGNGDWKRVRWGMLALDHFESLVAKLYGIRIENVKRKIESEFIEGSWILDSQQIVPTSNSDEWKNCVCLFWVHGGGLGAGSCNTGLLALQKILQMNPLFATTRLLIFSCQYPLSPEAKFQEQIDFCIRSYRWLVQDKGVMNLILVRFAYLGWR